MTKLTHASWRRIAHSSVPPLRVLQFVHAFITVPPSHSSRIAPSPIDQMMWVPPQMGFVLASTIFLLHRSSALRHPHLSTRRTQGSFRNTVAQATEVLA
jgi:hypothetical protein